MKESIEQFHLSNLLTINPSNICKIVKRDACSRFLEIEFLIEKTCVTSIEMK